VTGHRVIKERNEEVHFIQLGAKKKKKALKEKAPFMSQKSDKGGWEAGLQIDHSSRGTKKGHENVPFLKRREQLL